MFVGHPDYTGPRYSNVEKILGMQAYHDGEADDVPGLEVIDPLTIKITTDGVLVPSYIVLAHVRLWPSIFGKMSMLQRRTEYRHCIEPDWHRSF
jgi:hypothetical protein